MSQTLNLKQGEIVPKISIEIPVTWGNHLSEQMEALRNQTFQDYDISIASSMSNENIEDLLKEYDVRITHCGPNILEKRYLAHLQSRGEYSLLLDETRIPRPQLLSELQKFTNDMVVIDERDIGNTFWINMANLDKINSIECNSFEAYKGYVLPRYFNSTLLTRAFEEIREKLDDTIFKSVLMEDHQLIYYEASKLSTSIATLKGQHLFHYGDASLLSILKKYHGYGKGHKVLRNTYYQELLSPRQRVRKICSGNRLGLYIFYIARGIPFLIGYYLA
jgi:hypothetical protein